MISTIMFLALFSQLTAPPAQSIVILQTEPVNPYEAITRAVTTIESGNGRYLLNEKEMAVGWFGIRPVRLNDYNVKTHSNITLNECYEYETGRMIFLWYVSQIDYRDIKAISICWNGRSKENKYYAKLKARL